MKTATVLIILFLPFFTLAQHNNIKEAIKLKQFEKGLNIIDSLIEKKEATSLIYYYKSSIEQSQKKYDASISSAIIALKTTKKDDPLYPRIIAKRALSYAYSGNIKLGIIDNELLVKEFPNNLDNYFNLSYLYGENYQYYNCIKTLKQALILDSLNPNIMNNLAYYNSEAKDYKATIKYSFKGLPLTNDSALIASLLNNLGFAQAQIVSWEVGMKTIISSITYNKYNSYAFYNIGLLYFDKNDVGNACLNFTKSRQLGGINLTQNYMQYCK